MAELLQLEPPRWPGGPPICPYENLPAFATWSEAARFQEDNAPGNGIAHKWQCQKCGMWHFIGKPRQPSGTTSSSERYFEPRPPRYQRERLAGVKIYM